MNKDGKYLLGVSGGIDSMVMLHWMSGYQIAVAHFDHQIRQESSNDAMFVEETCRRLGIPFYLCREDIPLMSRGRNVEDVARERRRKFFQSCLKDGWDYVCLAHHANDQAETVFNNFIRGSSVHGLGGMLPVDEERKIIRPLLSWTKAEILQYAKQHGISWVEDRTNQDNAYDRNWLRNQVLPELETRRTVIHNLARNAEHYQQLSSFLTEQAKSWLQDDMEGFPLREFLNLHAVLQGEVLGILWGHWNSGKTGFSQKVIGEVTKWLSHDPEGGSWKDFGKVKMTRSKKRIIIKTS